MIFNNIKNKMMKSFYYFFISDNQIDDEIEES